MNNFIIKGWFPPIVFTEYSTGIKYAVCGGTWIAIPNEMTIQDVVAGWVCTAKIYPPKEIKEKQTIYPKKTKKSDLFKLLTFSKNI